ncbi:MAG TPA: thymidine phosphorylase [Anaerolineaceae bacterium]|nr:thymidine phosphorylase [Anaerolineaceae bacterium]
MRALDIISKKRDRLELSKDEITFLIDGYTRDEIPDYQMAAWAMAVLLNGMTHEETAHLTNTMANSGDVLNLAELNSIIVDKHSTGGVGDKTTLSIAPMVAACGLAVGKMSGRGLGYSGGTIDKLESIPGYRAELSTEEFISQLKDIGIVLAGQSLDLAPADGKLYALRDVTGTVPSIPLIASSIMSKKIAAGAEAIVLDVKVGEGAFMKTYEDARELAEVMVNIGKLSNRRVIALLSPMDQPLGMAVGNALELKEAVLTLRGKGPEDYHEHCLNIASYMLLLGKKANSLEEARIMAQKSINDGTAFEKFRQFVAAQGGDLACIDNLDLLAKAENILEITAESSGYIAEVNAQDVGEASVILGGGRTKKGDLIDPAVGVMVYVKIGDYVEKGQKLFDVHYNKAELVQNAIDKLKESIKFSEQPVQPPPPNLGVIGM